VILKHLSHSLTRWDFLLEVIVCFAYKINNYFTLVVAFLEVLIKFERIATYFGSLRVNLVLAPLGMPN